jgi:hypothetical protein
LPGASGKFGQIRRRHDDAVDLHPGLKYRSNMSYLRTNEQSLVRMRFQEGGVKCRQTWRFVRRGADCVLRPACPRDIRSRPFDCGESVHLDGYGRQSSRAGRGALPAEARPGDPDFLGSAGWREGKTTLSKHRVLINCAWRGRIRSVWRALPAVSTVEPRCQRRPGIQAGTAARPPWVCNAHLIKTLCLARLP